MLNTLLRDKIMKKPNAHQEVLSLSRTIRRTLNISHSVPRRKAITEKTAFELFQGYFNNKMAVILLLIQQDNPGIDSMMTLRISNFLDDIYHHMLLPDFHRKYRRIFQWLKVFFNRFPFVTPLQRKKAVQYIRAVYALFGLELDGYLAGEKPFIF